MDEYLMDIDRMINEGLGGGFIHKDYQLKQFELHQSPIQSSKPLEEGEE